MTYYIFIKDGRINGSGEAATLNENITNIEVSSELYEQFVENPNKFIYESGEIISNPNYEAEELAKETQRIGMLNLTGSDVERAIYKVTGMDFEDLIDHVSKIAPEGLDIKALKIELKANHFYRGNPYVNAIGNLLGFTSEQLDRFFEDGNYQHLLGINE